MEDQSNLYFSQSSLKNAFALEVYSSTNYLFQGEKQKFTIIWGDKNDTKDNKNAREGLIQRNQLLEGSIFQCLTTKDFRAMVNKYCQKNLIIIMSGTFATEAYEGTQNIEWLNKMIKEQSVHSKSIILFTSQSTVKKNNWSIESLQQKYSYVTQIAVEYLPLYESVNKMIYNRLHRSLDQVKNLDLYFGSKTDQILSYFLKNETIQFKDCRPSSNKLQSKLDILSNYVKEAQMKTPIVKYLDSLNKFYQGIEDCFTKNENKAAKNKYEEKQLVIDILKFYTYESFGYKTLNYSLNTMNPIVYEQLSTIYQLFSKCLYDFQDENKSDVLTLYRGAAIQKYQYDNLYNEFQINEKKNAPTFIIFPQFLSTSLSMDIAKELIALRFNEVKQVIQSRVTQEIQQNPSQFDFLKSKLFLENYRVLIKIDAQIDLNNKYRPKSLKYISKYQRENEYLFQPFVAFKVKNIENSSLKTENSTCLIDLEYVI